MLPLVWGTRSSATGTARRKATRRKENCRLIKSDQNMEIIWEKIKTRTGTLGKEGTESRWTRLYRVNIHEPHWTCRALLLALTQNSSIFSGWPLRQTPANQILYWFVAVSLHQLQPQTCVLSRVISLFFWFSYSKYFRTSISTMHDASCCTHLNDRHVKEHLGGINFWLKTC